MSVSLETIQHDCNWCWTFYSESCRLFYRPACVYLSWKTNKCQIQKVLSPCTSWFLWKCKSKHTVAQTFSHTRTLSHLIASKRITRELCNTRCINCMRRRQSFYHTFFSLINSFCTSHTLCRHCTYVCFCVCLLAMLVCVCACVCVSAHTHGGWVCVYPCLSGMCVWLSILESSAGVGDRDDGGAQSEQGGQEMGNQSGQRT